ncbi:MAG: hypothetical protein M3O31_07265 [Acidobacteriota bacterium]|nr:hypothetical protein [Acidobacteriota bacterium]
MIGNVVLVYNGTFDLPLLAAQTDASAGKMPLLQHRNAEALAHVQHAAQLAPDSADVTHVLALALRANARTADADAAAARSIHLAQTIYPDFQKALAK